MIVSALILLASAAQSPADNSSADVIIVQARRGRCEIVFAGSKLDGRGLQKLANGWPAGRPLRVLEPRGADQKCLNKMALELADRGFNDLQFVDPPVPAPSAANAAPTDDPHR